MSGSVLFVDDEEYVLNSIERLFSDLDFNILKAANADEALKVFAHEEIAVIVSDHSMPGMKGVELLSKVKALSPDTLKILMTAHANLGVAVDAINDGEVFRFILKPWDNASLINTVEEAVNRYHVIQSLKNVDKSTLLSLAQTIELKDPYTRGHCERVSKYALMIANELDLSDELIKSINYGSWLHDCGKIGVPGNILNKTGPLDETEFNIIKKHPRMGSDVVRQANLSETIINIVLYHHERYDGTGYPTGLKGDSIPIEARIVTVADIFDALTSDRSYRDKYSEDRAIKIMFMMRGNVLDPVIIDTFLYRCLKLDKETVEALSSKVLNES